MERFQIQNLTFTYPEQDVPVLRDVCVALAPGDFTVLAGLLHPAQRHAESHL